MKKNINELLLLEGITLSSLSDGVLRKLQTLRLGKSESFNLTQDNVSEMTVSYTLPTAENVMDNILSSCRLFTNKGTRLIDLIISKDGDYRFYPNSFFYYTDSELNNNVALEPIKNALEEFQINTSINHRYFARIADESSIEEIQKLMPKESYLCHKLKKEFAKSTECNVRYSYLIKVIAGLNLIDNEVK
ncbi:hypothetical protein [Brochothrix thermosphacta]|uniref:hypothetical protein n=1 Tax=Brochothrix thermosphacta TaxID=2756 RepID=UPI00048EAB96|nr:hypothetical protein [Brochothrix thermosphacta]ODJ48110.1 hypothetical protein BFR34_11380 [Brochothrix thermosphacta DSM 20171 = FSL F6-1036]